MRISDWSSDVCSSDLPDAASRWLVVPYLAVVVRALSGLNVVVVLGIGIALAGLFGFVLSPGYDWPAFAGDIYGGYESMVEITLLSLLIGGLAALARASGGLQWLADAIAGFSLLPPPFP